MSDFFLFPKPVFDFHRDFLAEKLKEHYGGIELTHVDEDSRAYELEWYYTVGERYLDGRLSKGGTSIAFSASDAETLTEFVVWIRKMTNPGIVIMLMDESADYEIEILENMSEEDIIKALEANWV